MSLVTRGIGGNSLLVTGGLGFKDLITSILEENTGGLQFHKKRNLAFLSYTFNLKQDSVKKLSEIYAEDIPTHEIDDAVSNLLSNHVIGVDGSDYKIKLLNNDVRDLVYKAKDLDEKVNLVMKEANVTRRDAKRLLVERAKHELKHSLKFQKTYFNDDMDIIEILLLSDEL